MKKGVLLFIQVIIVITLKAQGSFQFMDYSASTSINSAEYLNGKWFLFGSKGDCSVAWVWVLDQSGNLQWTDSVSSTDISTFYASTLKGGNLYAVGKGSYSQNQDDDITSAGLIQEMAASGGLSQIVNDTIYENGFHAIATDGNILAVAGSRYATTGNIIEDVVAYDISGNKLWTYTPGWDIRGLTRLHNILYVFGADSIVSLEMRSGQQKSYKLDKGFGDVCIWKSDYLAVSNKDWVELYDSTLNFLASYQIGGTILVDSIHHLRTNSNNIVVVGRYHDNSLHVYEYGMVIFDPFGYPFSTVAHKIGITPCHAVDVMGMSETGIVLGGTDDIGGLPLGYMDGLPLNQTTLLYANRLSVVNSTSHIGERTSLGTNGPLGYYVNYDVSLRNTGWYTVRSFIVHSAYSQCNDTTQNEGFIQRFDNVDIAIGDTFTFTTPTIKALLSNADPFVLTIYVRAENGKMELADCDSSAFDLVPVLREDETVIIYPNPVGDNIYFTGLSNSVEFDLYNVIGQRVMRRELSNGEFGVNVSFLPTGVYYCVLNDQGNGKQYTKKLLKY